MSVLSLNSKCWASKRVKNLCEQSSNKLILTWSRQFTLLFIHLVIWFSIYSVHWTSSLLFASLLILNHSIHVKYVSCWWTWREQGPLFLYFWTRTSLERHLLETKKNYFLNSNLEWSYCDLHRCCSREVLVQK